MAITTETNTTAATLWERVTRDIRKAIASLTDRKQVVGREGNILSVLSYEPEATVPKSIRKIRGTPVGPDDDVLTISLHGHEIAIGALLKDGELDTGVGGSEVSIGVGQTVTGEPGTEAVVTEGGTSTNRIFNFLIPRGDRGEKGDTGSGVAIKGKLASTAELPATGVEGDGYLISGDLHVWDGTAWINAGPIQGPPGEGVPTGGTENQRLIYAPMGPAWHDGPVIVDYYSSPAQAAEVAGAGGTVEFTPGVTYAYADPILIQSSQRFLGSDPETTQLVPSGPAAFQVKDAVNGARWVRIAGLKINGGNALPVGVDFRGLVDSEIELCWILNILNYGVRFGGTYDVGGWSNRLMRSRVGTVVDGASVFIDGVNSRGETNGNKITIAQNVLRTNGTGNGHALRIAEGWTNVIVDNDMGYGASVAMVLDGNALYNVFRDNRVEQVDGAVQINGGKHNQFLQDHYHLITEGATHYVVEVNAGSLDNRFEPRYVSPYGIGGSQWGRDADTSCNTIYVDPPGTTTRTQSATDLVEASRAVGDPFNRYERLMSGLQRWGSGTSAPDVQLDRYAENVLRLAYGDDFMLEGGVIRMQYGYLWIGSDGKVRTSPTRPASHASTTEGTVVGSQS